MLKIKKNKIILLVKILMMKIIIYNKIYKKMITNNKILHIFNSNKIKIYYKNQKNKKLIIISYIQIHHLKKIFFIKIRFKTIMIKK